MGSDTGVPISICNLKIKPTARKIHMLNSWVPQGSMNTVQESMVYNNKWKPS
jgi:hypothetical protein